MRKDNRANEIVRPIKIEHDYTKHALGSVLISMGDTKVICTACIEDRVPHFLRDKGVGWLTAEYSMLPGATHTRFNREVKRGKPSGRTSEIERLIGRSLRGILDFELLGERTVYIDADVIQADGGTRTAAITGGMVALKDAIETLMKNGTLEQNPIIDWVAAVSVGKFEGKVICDLDYDEDSNAELDMNLVMTESGKFIEIQGTAEKEPFDQVELDELLKYGRDAIQSIIKVVKVA
ncbi:MAG: ribonuclease PH [Actinobacteria bacterium]|nr:ribonuclease PH [Actinomycetota bacterium]